MPVIDDRSKLTTEQRNPRSRDIDRRTTLQIVDIINAEDRKVPAAVGRERKAMAAAADLIVERLRRGGRLFYVGAGTSGRLGVLDASECPPTFGTPPSLVQGIIAGGRRALVRAIEGAEDYPEFGAAALDRKGLKPRDAVVGIAACGMTPFVCGAIERARRVGAATVFITCAPEVKGSIDVDVVINPDIGPEVVTGSTRMKAGTATKLVLNALTTTAMIQLGKVHGNLMVDLKATNEKLRDRAERIVAELTGLGRTRAGALLKKAHGDLKPAVVMHFRKVGFAEAEQILRDAGASLRRAIEEGA